jgi:hypothetical protein
MRGTYIDFTNSHVSSAFVELSPVASNFIVFDQSSYVVDINMPAPFDIANNPTKELFDRLRDLKMKYSTALLPNSKTPSDRAFQDARNFILTLPLTQIVKPVIHVASDGEVNFHWAGADFQIDLGFYGDETFSFYGAKDGHEPILGDDVSVKEGIPGDLVSFAFAS